MRNDNDPVRQENQKAFPKFVLVFVLSLVLGLALGFIMSALEFENVGELLEAFGTFFATRLAGWLLCACPVVELAVGLPLYFSAKKQIEAWDGEDEAVSEAAEQKLSVCIWITSMATVLLFFLAAGHFAGMAGDILMRAEMGSFQVFLGLGAFLVGLLLSMVFQQKLVDTTKRLNPEKRGSIYDTRFHKTWLESCDEAERAVIGQCAFKAYQAMGKACLTLWMVLALGGMFFDWGFLPSMAVCVIWGVGQSVYCYWCLKLSKPGGAL